MVYPLLMSTKGRPFYVYNANLEDFAPDQRAEVVEEKFWIVKFCILFLYYSSITLKGIYLCKRDSLIILISKLNVEVCNAISVNKV